MICIFFDDRLDDGREVGVYAYFGGRRVVRISTRLDGTGFPVSITDAEFLRLGSIARQRYEDWNDLE